MSTTELSNQLRNINNFIFVPLCMKYSDLIKHLVLFYLNILQICKTPLTVFCVRVGPSEICKSFLGNIDDPILISDCSTGYFSLSLILQHWYCLSYSVRGLTFALVGMHHKKLGIFQPSSISIDFSFPSNFGHFSYLPQFHLRVSLYPNFILHTQQFSIKFHMCRL